MKKEQTLYEACSFWVNWEIQGKGDWLFWSAYLRYTNTGSPSSPRGISILPCTSGVTYFKNSSDTSEPWLVIRLFWSAYLRYTNTGSPSSPRGISILPCTSGVTYFKNSSDTSEPWLVIHSFGTPFSSLQIRLTSSKPHSIL